MSCNGSNPWNATWNKRRIKKKRVRPGFPPLGLFYGTEIELALTPKAFTARNWDEVARELSAKLTLNKIRNEILDDSKASNYSLDIWVVTGDGSIERDKLGNVWGVELVSPIRDALDPFSTWTQTCSRVWNALAQSFDIVPSDSCGTHVHISWIRVMRGPVRGSVLEPVKRVAKGVIWFERFIDSLMPDHRLGNVFCRSNRYNVRLREKSISEIMEMIDAVEPDTPDGTSGITTIVDLLCPDDGNNSSRCYKWNFTPMLREKIENRTIEFRQPPGSGSHEEWTFWCQFAHTFIWAILSPRYWDYSEYYSNNNPSLGNFLHILKNAGEEEPFGEFDEGLFERAFKDKVLLPDVSAVETQWTEEDIKRIRSKDAAEELKMQRAEACYESSGAETAAVDEISQDVSFELPFSNLESYSDGVDE